MLRLAIAAIALARAGLLRFTVIPLTKVSTILSVAELIVTRNNPRVVSAFNIVAKLVKGGSVWHAMGCVTWMGVKNVS